MCALYVHKAICFHRVNLAWGMCRGLALLNNIGVVSASHDQTLRVWTFQGDCIAELVGHTALVYSAACSDDGSLIASASEDNTVRTWRPDGQCLQTIEHPGTVCSSTSLWQYLTTNCIAAETSLSTLSAAVFLLGHHVAFLCVVHHCQSCCFLRHY